MQLIQYNSAALFVGPADALGIHSPSTINMLHGIQSASFDFSEPLSDIEGTEGSFQQIHLTPANVNLSFGYYVREAWNEYCMGFITNGTGSALANFWNDERNYFVAMRNSREDLYGYTGYDSTVIAFTQGCIASYGVQAAVGAALTANASISFLNVGVALSGNNVQLPVVNKQDGTIITSYGMDTALYSGSGDDTLAAISGSDVSNDFTGSGITTDFSGDTLSQYFTGSGDTTDYNSVNTIYTIPFNTGSGDERPAAISPGNLILNLPNDSTFGVICSGLDACIVQSFDISTAFIRQDDQPLGYTFPKTRRLDPPIELRVSVNAYVNKYKYGMLNDRLCNTTGQTIELIVRDRCADFRGDIFTGDGSTGTDWATDPFSFLFTGSGDATEWVRSTLDYLYNGSEDVLRYRIDGAKLESTSVNFSVGAYQQVTFNWSAKIFQLGQTGTQYANLTITAPYTIRD